MLKIKCFTYEVSASIGNKNIGITCACAVFSKTMSFDNLDTGGI
jgi:hypothetical protein